MPETNDLYVVAMCVALRIAIYFKTVKEGAQEECAKFIDKIHQIYSIDLASKLSAVHRKETMRLFVSNHVPKDWLVWTEDEFLTALAQSRIGVNGLLSREELWKNEKPIKGDICQKDSNLAWYLISLEDSILIGNWGSRNLAWEHLAECRRLLPGVDTWDDYQETCLPADLAESVASNCNKVYTPEAHLAEVKASVKQIEEEADREEKKARTERNVYSIYQNRHGKFPLALIQAAWTLKIPISLKHDEKWSTKEYCERWDHVGVINGMSLQDACNRYVIGFADGTERDIIAE